MRAQRLIKLVELADSDLTINWLTPNLSYEVDEYFENEATRDFLLKHGYEFNTEKELLAVLSKGSMKEISREVLQKQGQNLTLTDEEFQDELKDPDYAASYYRMRDQLVKEKSIKLQAPILLYVDNIYWGFAGNRRSNLAWNHDITVKFYVVTL